METAWTTLKTTLNFQKSFRWLFVQTTLRLGRLCIVSWIISLLLTYRSASVASATETSKSIVHFIVNHPSIKTKNGCLLEQSCMLRDQASHPPILKTKIHVCFFAIYYYSKLQILVEYFSSGAIVWA